MALLSDWLRQEAKTKQQQNKTTFTATTWKKPRVFADKLPLSANGTFFHGLSQGLCTDWLVCIAYCKLHYPN